MQFLMRAILLLSSVVKARVGGLAEEAGDLRSNETHFLYLSLNTIATNTTA